MRYSTKTKHNKIKPWKHLFGLISQDGIICFDHDSDSWCDSRFQKPFHSPFNKVLLILKHKQNSLQYILTQLASSDSSVTPCTNIFKHAYLRVFIKKINVIFVLLKINLPHHRILSMLPSGAAQGHVVWRTWPAVPTPGGYLSCHSCWCSWPGCRRQHIVWSYLLTMREKYILYNCTYMWIFPIRFFTYLGEFKHGPHSCFVLNKIIFYISIIGKISQAFNGPFPGAHIKCRVAEPPGINQIYGWNAVWPQNICMEQLQTKQMLNRHCWQWSYVNVFNEFLASEIKCFPS